MSNLNNAVVKAATAMLIKFNNRLNKSQRENETTLTDWAEYLALERKYTVAQIGLALNNIMSKGVTFMPSAYEIEAELKPAIEKKEDLAPVIANEIISFVRLHHFDLEKNYFHTLSEIAQETIKANGGTQSIRDSENLETMKAQLERLIRGVIAARENNSKNETLQKIGIAIPASPGLRPLDFAGFLPEVNV